MDSVFSEFCNVLCDCVVVVNAPCVSDSFVQYTDASGWGISACLHIVCDGVELPVAFFGRQLNGAENHYSVTKLETLAIVVSVKHFEYYLYGAAFVVYTDHRPCVTHLTSTFLNHRLNRFALKLREMDIDIRYRPGCMNGNADNLSSQNCRTEEEHPDSMETIHGSCQTHLRGEVLGGGGKSGSACH